MHPHHQTTIDNVVDHFRRQDEVLAVLLTGSVAHGFSRAGSDVDIAIVVSEAEFERRKLKGELTFYDTALCTYPEGYVDGKFMDLAFIQDVARRGSEPARFAFKDASVLWSRVAGLESLIADASRYPEDSRDDKLRRFQAQFEAWYWYVQQAFQTQDTYLLHFAVAKLVLFGCRQVLAFNRTLFPYHKWLTRVVQEVPAKPERFGELLEAVMRSPTPATTAAFFQAVSDFLPRVEGPHHWSIHFMVDSELNWKPGPTPVDDL